MTLELGWLVAGLISGFLGGLYVGARYITIEQR